MPVKKSMSMESFGTLEGLQQGTRDSSTSKVPRSWQVVQEWQKDGSARSPGLAFEARVSVEYCWGGQSNRDMQQG